MAELPPQIDDKHAHKDNGITAGWLGCFNDLDINAYMYVYEGKSICILTFVICLKNNSKYQRV